LVNHLKLPKNQLDFNIVSLASNSGIESFTIQAHALTVSIEFNLSINAVLITIAVSRKSFHKVPNAHQ